MSVSGAVFYGVYDALKSRHLAHQSLEHPEKGTHQRLSTGHTLLFGAASGACSELAVYPLEILRRRMQLLSMAAAKAPRGAGGPVGVRVALLAVAAAPHLSPRLLTATWTRVAQAASSIVAAEGLAGFCTGLLPNMLQVLPASALSYLTYDQAKVMLGVEP